MRKSIFGIFILSILIASCSKNGSTQTNGGSWTFNSNTYQTATCIADSTLFTLTATNTVSGNPYSNIVVSFYNRLPDSTATYIVAKEGNLSPGHLGISLAYQTSSTTTFYGSSGGNGINEKVNVVVANGKINVSGTGIEMLNLGGNTDSTKLTFNTTQTQ